MEEQSMTDVDAYLEHIGYTGARTASLDVLRALHLLHTQTFPFENLNPLLGMEVTLDLPSLVDKFTRQGRGGYCFEHNRLFRHVLDTLGFRTAGLAARVRLNVPDDIETQRSHMLLLVEIDGERYIADTGFGGMTLTAPIRLMAGIGQDTPHGQFRLLQDGPLYKLEALVEKEWKALYIFDLVAQLNIDYEVGNWYVASHPRSNFVTGLVAALPRPEGRHTLRNAHYSFYGQDGSQQKRELHTVGELKEVLENVFRIRLSALPGLDQRLARLLQS